MAATVFSTQLQKLRRAKGVTQEQLADYLGVSFQAVSKWENGSYPDGDLLPRIAKYFGVSIDYLYGDEQEQMTMQERVEEYMKGGDMPETMLKLAWMMAQGGIEGLSNFPIPEIGEDTPKTGTCILDNYWHYYMQHSKEMRYVSVAEVSKEGYETYLADIDKLAQMFRFFGEENNIKLILFMLSLKTGTCVRAEVVAEYLGISKENVEKALDMIKAFCNGNSMVEETNLMSSCGKNEVIYSTCDYLGLPYLQLLMAAKAVIYPVNNWYGLLCKNENPLINWERFKKEQEKRKNIK